MRISLVIPNFNGAATLERAIVSILAQNYPALQLIMADSASTDGSGAIIDKYRDRFEVILREKDAGQADGLNRGFRHANGEIFGWLCADDELMPGSLAEVARIFAENPEVDVVIGGCERVYADGQRAITKADPATWNKIGMIDVVEQPSTFWRASLHRRLGELATGYRLAFDWDWWCRMRDAGAKLATTENVLSRYHFSAENKSGNAGRIFEEEAFRIVSRYGPLGGGLAYIFRMLYRHFDLKGCYDQPPTCSRLRGYAFMAVLIGLRGLFGKRLIYTYNWHFASLQERNLPWW
jgi:glycosyltransferase involved in cell wall biosynthesis